MLHQVGVSFDLISIKFQSILCNLWAEVHDTKASEDIMSVCLSYPPQKYTKDFDDILYSEVGHLNVCQRRFNPSSTLAYILPPFIIQSVNYKAKNTSYVFEFKILHYLVYVKKRER